MDTPGRTRASLRKRATPQKREKEPPKRASRSSKRLAEKEMELAKEEPDASGRNGGKKHGRRDEGGRRKEGLRSTTRDTRTEKEDVEMVDRDRRTRKGNARGDQRDLRAQKGVLESPKVARKDVDALVGSGELEPSGLASEERSNLNGSTEIRFVEENAEGGPPEGNICVTPVVRASRKGAKLTRAKKERKKGGSSKLSPSQVGGSSADAASGKIARASSSKATTAGLLSVRAGVANDAFLKEMTLKEAMDLSSKLRQMLNDVITPKAPTSPPAPRDRTPRHWGNLYSQDPKDENVPLRNSPILLGRSAKCAIQLGDTGIAQVAVRLSISGNNPFIEPRGMSTPVYLNGKLVPYGQKVFLHSGDAILINGTSRFFGYIFELLKPPQSSPKSLVPSRAQKSSPSSAKDSVGGEKTRVVRFEEDSPPKEDGKDVQDLSKSPTQDFSLENPTRKTSKAVKPSLSTSKEVERSSSPSGADDEEEIDEVKSSAQESALERYKTPLVKLSEVNKNLHICPSHGQQPGGKPIQAADAESKREIQHLLEAKKQANLIFASSYVRHEAISACFDNFPYSFLSSDLRDILILCTYIHLRHPEFAPLATKFPGLSQRILLYGGAGTQKYQEALIHALAKHLRADVLTLDVCAESLRLCGDSTQRGDQVKERPKGATNDPKPTASSNAGEQSSECVFCHQVHSEEDGKALDLLCKKKNSSNLGQVSSLKSGKKKAFVVGDRVTYIGASNKYGNKLDSLGSFRNPGGRKVSLRPGEGGTPLTSTRRRSRGRDPQRFIDVWGAVDTLNMVDKQMAKNLPLRALTTLFDDGIASAYNPGGQAGGQGGLSREGLFGSQGKPWRGPWVGAKGRVVLAFSSDAKNVGVKFDSPINGGNNLGERCDPQYGFFVKAEDLCHEGDEEIHVKAVPTVIRHILSRLGSEVAEGRGIVVHVKDVERSLNRLRDEASDVYKELTSAFSKLPTRVVLIGTSADTDGSKSHGTSLSGLLPDLGMSSFSRRGSSASATLSGMGGLGSIFYPSDGSFSGGTHSSLDLSLLDHLSRWELDRTGTGPSRTATKAILRLFPNRLFVPGPQSSHKNAEKFRKEIERDVKSARVGENRKKIGKVVERMGLEVTLEGVNELETQVFSDSEISRIMGFALAYELRERDESSGLEEAQKDGKSQVTFKTVDVKGSKEESGDLEAEVTKNRTCSSSKQPPDLKPVLLPAAEAQTPVKQPEAKPSKILNHEIKTVKMSDFSPAKILGKKRSREEDENASVEVSSAKKRPELKPHLKLSSSSISKGIKIVVSQRNGSNKDAAGKDKTPLSKVSCSNEFERRLLSEVVPASEIGVKFNDIGALDSCKEALQEIVMLPLRRPELFRKGNLTKPTKGVLLFGPPGTGKTMLAKAVATEAGANFINITMSSIASKWFGEGEKYVKALFSLASKIAPSVIFIDEVDSMLGKRERPGEHEAMRKIKNEFMLNWDGLRSKDSERVLVLGATNRPFDLDDAVLRRMPRRLLVDLPDAKNRTKILSVITCREDMDGSVDLEALAETLEGYSGSDLRNLCVAAAHAPIREILASEKKAREQNSADGASCEDDKVPEVRPLKQEDFLLARNEVSASVSEDTFAISELRKWNEIYGEGGSRRKAPLPYFM